jgi:histidinol phosphatase-like PHP family hydrolase
MKADLHMHSKYSDGKQWPEEIVALAKSMNFEMLALTDHDTMEGVDRFLKACSNYGINGIPAVEIDYDVKQIHYNSELLGYFPGGRYSRTKAILNDLLQMRKWIAIEAISIVAIGHNRNDLSFDGLLRHKLNEPLLNLEDLNISITKPDLFNYFIDKNIAIGYGKDDYSIFKKEFFDRPVFTKISTLKPGLIDWIHTINDDGGFAVLAHPAYHYKLNAKEMNEERNNCLSVFKQLREQGLWGIELHSYDNETNRIPLNDFFSDIANELGLHLTCGSDSHNVSTTDSLFGEFYRDFEGFSR